MVNNVRRPRIEGTFAGERMRAFDVVWGSITGARDHREHLRRRDERRRQRRRFRDAASTAASRSASRAATAARRSTRASASISRPLADLRHAFDLDDYNVDGLFSGEFHVFGAYLDAVRLRADGDRATASRTAQPFETATAAVRLDGEGVRLDSLQIVQAGGRAPGAAWVGLNGTYSFNLDGRGIPLERCDAC